MSALNRNMQLGGARAKVRGVALVIALLLLVVLTLLASTGVRMSVGELWMAGNEQAHRHALDAASAGIELAIARIRAGGGASAVRDGATTQAVGAAGEFTTSVRRAGNESVLVGSSAGRFAGDHFEIESVGTSSRSARDIQIQGVMVVTSTDGVARYARMGAGVGAESEP